MKAERTGPPTRREALRLWAACGVAAALGAVTVAELVRRGRLRRVAATRIRMGAPASVTVVHPDASEARAMVESAFAEMERLEGVLSRHRPGTALDRLNRDGALRPAPPELIEVLSRALHHSRRTGGAFDVTVAPVLDAWTRSLAATGGPPGARALSEARDRVGWRDLRVAEDGVSLLRPGMALTLDGIAKGYVVDRTVGVLTRAGAGRVMVEAGGDLASSGDGPEGGGWRIAIRDPRRAGVRLGLLRLHGRAVATSGDYVETFTPDRSHHHIVDPRTGRSPAHASSVTVTAPTAMDADALSTAAFVMGPHAGPAMLEAIDGVEGVVVGKGGDTVATRGFRAFPPP